LAAVRAAGADRVAWSRAHGVDARSLNAWRVALERRVASKRPTLVELVPAPLSPTARYVVDLGAARIELDDHCSADTLQRMVRALRAC
jgi:hypothetical protein